MAKELERAGIPCVQICALTSIAVNVGAPRVFAATAIPHPLGNPKLSAAEEFLFRKEMLHKALLLLTQMP